MIQESFDNFDAGNTGSGRPGAQQSNDHLRQESNRYNKSRVGDEGGMVEEPIEDEPDSNYRDGPNK